MVMNLSLISPTRVKVLQKVYGTPSKFRNIPQCGFAFIVIVDLTFKEFRLLQKLFLDGQEGISEVVVYVFCCQF